ncbi:30S ribosomal protein S17e [Candidatus Woesearchaeota archaeon]|nr:30S ribosomal protein S17e [Candidatus Woesearchaeota archaeon]
MGRIKTQLIKRITFKLMEKHRDAFTTDFEKNKVGVEQFVSLPSKKMRNIIAGYITRLKEKGEQ